LQGIDAQDRGDIAHLPVRLVGAALHGQAPALIEITQGNLPLQGRVLLEGGAVLVFDHHLAACESRRQVSMFHAEAAQHVSIRIERQRLRAQRLGGLEQVRQRLVGDVDGLHGLSSLLLALGHHHGYRRSFLFERLSVGCQHRLCQTVTGERVLPGDVLGGDHPYNAGQGRSPGGIQSQQAGMVVRAAQHTGMQHTGQADIFHIAGVPGDLAGRVDALGAAPNRRAGIGIFSHY
jgi:hypothetical protein